MPLENESPFKITDRLASSLGALLDSCDYSNPTRPACKSTEMVGAVIDRALLQIARQVLDDYYKEAKV